MMVNQYIYLTEGTSFVYKRVANKQMYSCLSLIVIFYDKDRTYYQQCNRCMREHHGPLQRLHFCRTAS